MTVAYCSLWSRNLSFTCNLDEHHSSKRQRILLFSLTFPCYRILVCFWVVSLVADFWGTSLGNGPREMHVGSVVMDAVALWQVLFKYLGFPSQYRSSTALRSCCICPPPTPYNSVPHSCSINYHRRHIRAMHAPFYAVLCTRADQLAITMSSQH